MAEVDRIPEAASGHTSLIHLTRTRAIARSHPLYPLGAGKEDLISPCLYNDDMLSIWTTL
jgi:hypothetical protein